MRAYLTARKHFRCSFFFFLCKLLKEQAHFELLPAERWLHSHFTSCMRNRCRLGYFYRDNSIDSSPTLPAVYVWVCVSVCVCVSVFQLNLRVHLPKTNDMWNLKPKSRRNYLSHPRGDLAIAFDRSPRWESEECRPGWLCVYIRKLLAILLKNDTTDIKESE